MIAWCGCLLFLSSPSSYSCGRKHSFLGFGCKEICTEKPAFLSHDAGSKDGGILTSITAVKAVGAVGIAL